MQKFYFLLTYFYFQLVKKKHFRSNLKNLSDFVFELYVLRFAVWNLFFCFYGAEVKSFTNLPN